MTRRDGTVFTRETDRMRSEGREIYGDDILRAKFQNLTHDRWGAARSATIIALVDGLEQGDTARLNAALIG